MDESRVPTAARVGWPDVDYGVLRRAGWRVEPVRTRDPDGDQIQQRIREIQPDVVLISSLTREVALGQAPAGYKVCHRLKQYPGTSRTKVIMVTSLQGPEHREKAEQAGVDLYLVTPVDSKALVAELNEIVRR